MQNIDTPTKINGNQTIRSCIYLKQNEQIDENLLCNICSELVIEPVECEDCQNLFCTQCINDWKKKSQICPFKCASNPIKLKPPHRLVKNALSSINFVCVNKAKGCNEIMSQDQLVIHSKECNFINIKCDNDGCPFTSLKYEIQDHKIQCQYTTVSCEKCNLSFYRRNQKDHDCLVSLIKRVNQLEKNEKNQDEIIHQLIQKTQIIDKLERQVQELSNKMERKCQKNHPLTWFRVGGRSCSQCQQPKTIRWICKVCSTGYCIDCKGPTFNKGHCPFQHKMILHQQCLSDTLICDLCKTKPKQTNQPYWSDRDCDFDICQKCVRNF